jgi:hypothetical protein
MRQMGSGSRMSWACRWCETPRPSFLPAASESEADSEAEEQELPELEIID